MRRAETAVVALVLLFVLAWEFVPLQFTIWDGAFHLDVEVAAEDDPPTRVSCQVYPWLENAEQETAAAELHETTRTRVTSAHPFVGEPLDIEVQCSGRTSPMGRELTRSQFKYLVVVAEWPEGRRVAKLFTIPDGRGPRSVRVMFP